MSSLRIHRTLCFCQGIEWPDYPSLSKLFISDMLTRVETVLIVHEKLILVPAQRIIYRNLTTLLSCSPIALVADFRPLAITRAVREDVLPWCTVQP